MAKLRKVKVYIVVDVDTEEYPIPVDEQLEDDLKEQFEAHVYDIDGLILNHIKVLVGDQNDITNRLSKLYSNLSLCPMA